MLDAYEFPCCCLARLSIEPLFIRAVKPLAFVRYARKSPARIFFSSVNTCPHPHILTRVHTHSHTLIHTFSNVSARECVHVNSQAGACACDKGQRERVACAAVLTPTYAHAPLGPPLRDANGRPREPTHTIPLEKRQLPQRVACAPFLAVFFPPRRADITPPTNAFAFPKFSIPCQPLSTFGWN